MSFVFFSFLSFLLRCFLSFFLFLFFFLFFLFSLWPTTTLGCTAEVPWCGWTSCGLCLLLYLVSLPLLSCLFFSWLLTSCCFWCCVYPCRGQSLWVVVAVVSGVASVITGTFRCRPGVIYSEKKVCISHLVCQYHWHLDYFQLGILFIFITIQPRAGPVFFDQVSHAHLGNHFGSGFDIFFELRLKISLVIQ